MSTAQADEVSGRLVRIGSCIPSNFAQKPRGLAEIDKWKATEYRQFLLYTGKLVLKKILRPDLFDHFLSFSVAMSILMCPDLVQQDTLLHYAQGLLKYFVLQGRILYGP